MTINNIKYFVWPMPLCTLQYMETYKITICLQSEVRPHFSVVGKSVISPDKFQITDSDSLLVILRTHQSQDLNKRSISNKFRQDFFLRICSKLYLRSIKYNHRAKTELRFLMCKHKKVVTNNSHESNSRSSREFLAIVPLA